MANNRERTTGERFAALDSWRGICACLVAIYHAPIYSDAFFVPLIRHAWLFVDFFFVLSGFVLSHAYAHKLRSRQEAGDFLIRRFGRLWPLHAATLAFLVLFDLIHISLRIASARGADVVLLAREPVQGALSILANLFLVNSMGVQSFFAGKFDWNFPSWSVSVEFYVCVMFAWLSAIAGKQKNWLLLIVCGLAAADYALNDFATNQPWLPFLRGAYGFLIGHFIYWLYLRIKVRIPVPTAVEIAVLIAVISFVSAASVDSRLWTMAPLVFGLAVFVFAHEAGVVSRFFKTTIAQKLGEWSYSIYLVHIPVLLLFEIFRQREGIPQAMISLPEFSNPVPAATFISPWYGDLALCLYMIGVISIASLTYRFLEKPARKFFYRYADVRRLQARF